MNVRLVSYTQPTEEFKTEGLENVQDLIAFCAKVSNPAAQINKETSERLNTWCTVGVGDYGDYSISGAIDGCDYGKYATQDDMVKVNDWEWLRNRFDEATKG